MTPETRTTLALAAGLGAVAGMRSMTAPALLSRRLARRPGRTSGAARLLATGPVPALLGLAALGELAADKTPIVPDRTGPPAVLGRVAAGAFTGAAVAGRRGGSAAGAALAGAAAALGATFLAYHLRRAAGERTGLPDPVLGVAEDAVAVSSGAFLAGVVA